MKTPQHAGAGRPASARAVGDASVHRPRNAGFIRQRPGPLVNLPDKSGVPGAVAMCSRVVESFFICLVFALNSAQAEPLSFDHGSGFYDSAFQLVLSAPVKGAAIYYTTNGATPRAATALRYQDALPISTTTIVRAAAFDYDKALTAPATRTFLFIPAILRQTAGQLPKSWGTNGSEPVPA